MGCVMDFGFEGTRLGFRPGNIIVNARNIDMIYIVDKQTKKVVWVRNA
jgi:hypothetical protein